MRKRMAYSDTATAHVTAVDVVRLIEQTHDAMIGHSMILENIVCLLDALLGKQSKGQLPQPAHWLNNLPRDFTVLQCQARALLAKQRGIAVEKVAWERGTIHHLRVTFGTHMAQHVSMNDLRRLMGHASITTTADFYVRVSEDLAARVAAAFRRTA